MNIDVLENVAASISELDDSGKIRQLVNEALVHGIPAAEIVEKGLRKGLDCVGKRYEAGEYFLSELLFAGSLMKDALEVLEPRSKLEKTERKEVIVLGTVRGDIHDIGKNVFKMLAQAAGFEVLDLGVDVEPETFVEKLNEARAKILGLSALLTTTRWEMKTIIDELKNAGVRGNVRVLLGGNAVTKDFAREIGADSAALDAVEGVRMCKKWVTEK